MYTIKPMVVSNIFPFTYIKQNLENGKIFSLDSNSYTLKQLDLIIKYVRQKGYDFVTLEEILNENIEIPCTGCSYCTEGCPKKIAIPKYFSLYNADKQEVATKSWRPQGEYYTRQTHTFGKASECIGCGQCEAACPQHLPIIENLQKVAEYFEN